jgi:hypothetical protein
MLLKKSTGHFTGTELEIGELQYKSSDVFDREQMEHLTLDMTNTSDFPKQLFKIVTSYLKSNSMAHSRL